MPKPLRVGGQRRYSTDAIQRLAVLRLAQACGFHLDEMRLLLHGFGTGVKPPRRWQELAKRKQRELDAQIARLEAMRRVVNQVTHCQCLVLSECGCIAAAVLEAAR